MMNFERKIRTPKSSSHHPATMLILLILCLFVSNFSHISCDLTKIVDLTWDFDNDTIYWDTSASFKYTKMIANEQEKGYWYAMNDFCAGEHGGTHFDAPYHFNREGWKVSDVPIARLVAKGAVLEPPNGTKLLLPHHLEEWVRTNGQFEDNTVLLVKFGRSHLWPDRKRYMDLDSEGNLDFPGLSGGAANWIVNSGKIVGVGLDTPSVDAGSNGDLMAHRILAKGQIYGLENVKLLEELPAKGFVVVVAPMKLKEGTGAPLRVLAVPKGLF